MSPIKDVVIVGARRIKSERRGSYWVSVGAHMFPEPDSVVGALVQEFGLETLPINGSLMGLSYRGRMLKGGRTSTTQTSCARRPPRASRAEP